MATQEGPTRAHGAADTAVEIDGAKSKINVSDVAEAEALTKVGVMTEAEETSKHGAVGTAAEAAAAGEQSETGEEDAGAAAAVKEEGTTTTAGMDDAEMNTDVKESNLSEINGGTTSADVGTIDRAQPLTSVGAELLVERQEPLKAGIKRFKGVQEHPAGKKLPLAHQTIASSRGS